MDDGRFWITDVGYGQFGEDTVGIVDEHEGGIILYAHSDNAGFILESLEFAGLEN